jgi:hypothetical protein
LTTEVDTESEARVCDYEISVCNLQTMMNLTLPI